MRKLAAEGVRRKLDALFAFLFLNTETARASRVVLLLGAGVRMAAQFPAKGVPDLGHDLNLRRVINFGIFQLMNRVLVVYRAGREMDQVGRVITEQSGAD